MQQNRNQPPSDLFKLISAIASDPYTKMFQLNAIGIPSEKIVLRQDTLVVIENGKWVSNSKKEPTHRIKMLHGTLADNQHSITVENLIDNAISIIKL